MDDELRRAQRAWEQGPTSATAEGYIRALRRVNEHAPLSLLEARREPARRIETDAPFDVRALAGGRDEYVGVSARDAGGCELPECEAWWFSSDGHAVQALVDASREHGATRLDVSQLPKRVQLDGLRARSLYVYDQLRTSAWRRLAGLEELEELSVQTLPTEADAALPPNVVDLAVGRLWAQAHALVRRARPLVALTVGGWVGGGLADLARVADLSRLEALSFDGPTLDALPAAAPLRRLRLTGRVTDVHVAALAAREGLEDLRLRGASFGAAGLRVLARPGLRTLELTTWPSLPEVAVADLSASRRLRRLTLDGGWRSDAPPPRDPVGPPRLRLAALTLPELEDLELVGFRDLEAHDLDPDAVPALRRLTIAVASASSAAAVARLSRLERLDARAHVTPPGALERLSESVSLRTLRVAVDGAGADALGRLLASSGLTDLSVRCASIDPPLVSACARSPRLRRLQLDAPRRDPPIDVAPLAALTTLEELTLSGTETATVEQTSWAALSGLSRLRVVRCMSKAAAATARAALPGVHVLERLPTPRTRWW